MKIVLASQSPRRRELLGKMGLEFTVIVSQLEEDRFTGLAPAALVTALAREKAALVAAETDPAALVIAADTVVVLEEAILGKPSSPQEAVDMLTALSGRTHQVYTGVSVRQNGREVTEFEATQVTFRGLTQSEIADYVATGEPMDKAGAYGIQGYGSLLVEGIQGDYCNVVGLPVERLGRMLRAFGVDPLAQAAQRERRCQDRS